MSKNDIMTAAIIRGLGMFNVTPSSGVIINTSDSGEKTTLESEVTPSSGVKTEKVEKTKSVDSDTKKAPIEAKVTPPSRAPYNNIFNINKNIVNIYNKELEEAWTQYLQFKKEQRKAIKPTQLKFIWNKFEKIIKTEGVDGLILAINQTIERGYTTVFPVAPNQREIKKESTGGFSEDDL